MLADQPEYVKINAGSNYQTGWFFVVLLLFVCSSNLLKGQNAPEPIPSDSVSTEKAKPELRKKNSLFRYFKEDYPSPKKAVILAIVPGMGQVYNKKFWKLPLVYGSLGGVIYAINYNTTNYNRTVQSLEAKAGNIPVENDPFPSTPVNAVQARRNSFDKNRQLSWIGLIGFYLISAGDAFVDAHLKDFNVDDNISFKLNFEQSIYQQPVVGLGLSLTIDGKK